MTGQPIDPPIELPAEPPAEPQQPVEAQQDSTVLLTQMQYGGSMTILAARHEAKVLEQAEQIRELKAIVAKQAAQLRELAQAREVEPT